MDESERIEALRDALLSWSAGNLRQFPWRETRDPYEVLVAEILLQRTFAGKVEPVYVLLIERYPTVDELGEAEAEDVAEILEPLGLQNKRGRALVRIGNSLAESGVPEEETELLELPFVGKYAANATLCFAFDRP